MKARCLLISMIFFLAACQKDDSVEPNLPNQAFSRDISIIQDEVNGLPVVVAGSPGLNFMVAYERNLSDGTMLEFEVEAASFPTIMTDQEGNAWNILGKAVQGPRLGQQLQSTTSYTGFWFAWGTMFPGVEIYEGDAASTDIEIEPAGEDWGIPTGTVISATGLDSIPSIDEPELIRFREKDYIETGGFYLDNSSLVAGVVLDGAFRLFPHNILNWHEIVNDTHEDLSYAFSFCPLTGTATAWNREIDGEVSTFGVSGLLYNSNLVPYDRSTQSFWSQMRLKCVNGDRIGYEMETLPVIETNWSTWLEITGQPIMLSTNTGYNKNYRSNPYGSYPTNHELVAFPIEYDDPRLPRKERVLGVIVDEKAKVFRFESFN